MEKFGVYKKIHKAVELLRVKGIEKNRTCKAGVGGTYGFRGIDDVYNALSSVLSEVGLLIIPRVVSVQSNMIPRDNGKFSEHAIIHTEFTLADPDDGSTHIGSAYGEAIDTSDKAFGKAQSYAYKAFIFQAFCVPTEGDNDTENHSHDAGVPTLTDTQTTHIEMLIDVTGSNVDNFLRYAKASSVKSIKQSDYQSLVSVLEKKRNGTAQP